MIRFNSHKNLCDSVPIFKKSKNKVCLFRFFLLILLLPMFIPLLIGCTPNATPFQEGTYISDNTSGTIPGIKLILTEIDKDAYTNAGGLNVIQETVKPGGIHYFSFELFIYVSELEDYRQLNIIGFKQQKGAPQTYYLECDTSQQDAYGLESANITFVFDDRPFLLLDEYYYLNLKND